MKQQNITSVRLKESEMNNDDKVLNLIKQIIKEVKQEIRTKKVLTESKNPKEIFNKHVKNEREYITKIILETLNEAKK